MEFGTILLVGIAAIAIISGCLAVALRWLFPRIGDWLPVLSVTYIPPIVILSLLPFALENHPLETGPDAPDGPVVFGTHLMLFGQTSMLWLLVACPAAFLALAVYKRMK